MEKRKKYKIYIETYGCTFNQAESIYMKNRLERDYIITENPQEADLIIVNSCTVKQGAETKLYKALRKYKDKKVIVAGCVPQAEPKLKDTKLKDYSIIGPGAINRIGEAVKGTLNNKRFVDLTNYRPKKVGKCLIKNKIIGIVPINEGCLGNCYFCKTKHSRGDLFSYPKEWIIEHVKDCIKKGAKELWITSQDTGAYGLDRNTDMIDLIKDIISIERETFYWVRIGMMNPNHSYRMRGGLGELYKDKHLFKFLHISVQSGSDKVLKEMNRPHKVEDYVRSVEYYREIQKDMTIATDIIVGYPTETEEDFELTLKVIEKTKPDIVNISRFWPRPNTVAAGLKRIDFKIIKSRLQRIHEVVDEIIEKRNERWIGWCGKVLIDEYGKRGTLKGRNYAYKQIVIKKEKEIDIGSIVEVEIISSRKTFLLAKPLKVINDKKEKNGYHL